MTETLGRVADLAPAYAVPDELVGIFKAHHNGAPRSQQRRIGPSGLGTTCIRCLVHMLAETPTVGESAWYTGVGTAVHQWAEIAVATHEFASIKAGMAERYHCEIATTVASITHPTRPGEVLTITGTADLYDAAAAAVIDYKCLGRDALAELGRGRVKAVYRHQLQLYGYGLTQAGYRVDHVIVLGIPRNAESLDECRSVIMTYDQDDALNTLARAEAWARLILASMAVTGSPSLALALAGDHNRAEFTCRQFGDLRPLSAADSADAAQQLTRLTPGQFLRV